MDSELRQNYMTNLLYNSNNSGTMNVAYKQTHVMPMEVYKIDLSYLVYNQYNGRIGTLVKAYEMENGQIEAETSKGKKLIEKFLWESSVNHNNRTMKNLEEVGQRDPGIVTLDGVIIDGNRRAYLLNKIAEKNNITPAYFDAVILPDTMGQTNIREIKKLETQYQMGLDEKLGYNALEKYLQIQSLVDNDFSLTEIAKLMNEDESQIKKFWEVKNLMDEYLDYFGYENMYTRLEHSEDWFWGLQESMNRFDLGNGNQSSMVSWSYKKYDVDTLKKVMFDYIRVSREAGGDLLGGPKAFRDICTAGKSGFFRTEKVWKDFAEQHAEDFDSINEESIDEYRKLNPDLEITDVLKQRDKDFTGQLQDKVKANFFKTQDKVQTEIQRDEPKKLLQSALSKLEAVDENGSQFEAFCRNESHVAKNLIRDIGKHHYKFKKTSDKLF